MNWRIASRRWLPVLVGLAAVAAAFFLRQRLARQQDAEISAVTRSQALLAKSQTEAEMASRVLALSRLASRWKVWGQPVETDWEQDAALLMSGYPGYQAIEWVDPAFRARWIAPLIGNQADLDLDFGSEARRRSALNAAQDMHDVFITRPIELTQGGRGFLVCVPIFSGESFSGFIVGVFRYQDLLDRVLEDVPGDYRVAVFDGDDEVYARPSSSPPRANRWSQSANANLSTHVWQVRVWPAPETLARASSPLPGITLVGGLFVAWLLAALVHVAQTAEFQAREVIAAHETLKTEIRERQQAEEQLRQAQKMEAVGRLAGGVAHDFNNLLLIIKGHALLSLKSIAAPSPLRKNLKDILSAAERASSLTRKLLAFGRKQVLQPKVLDLNSLVTQVAELLPPLLGEDIRLVTSLKPRLGRVKADPGQIEQVIVNLAVNARDAMPMGGELTIQTANVEWDESASQHRPKIQPGSHVMLAVKDTGHGMDAETLSRAFEPFFTTKEKNKGTGLGLSTVYGIVEQSGGTITVSSVPGQGTAVTIYFARTQEPLEQIDARKPAAGVIGGSETILVVEDDDAVRKMTRTFLTTKGYTVIEARNAAEALEIAERNCESIDLILTDLVMPGMKGRELAERMAKEHRGLPVLYMSAYTEDSVVNRGILDPGTAFIEKPFGPDDLAGKVRELLESSARHAAADL
jgi:signal transduction histidine kinase/ActR/RegA family two-component response regulator